MGVGVCLGVSMRCSIYGVSVCVCASVYHVVPTD